MFLRSTIICLAAHSRGIHRYVAPTLREIRRRNKKFPMPQNPRSEFIEWNYNAELYAFSKRLNESFDIEQLQKAFVHRSHVNSEEAKKKELGIYDENNPMQDNANLITKGRAILTRLTSDFLKSSLPNLPNEGVLAIQSFLINDEMLSNLAANLGMDELTLSAETPLSKCTQADTFRAVVGALAESSGTERAGVFVKDFVCTQLNQKDLTECWNIDSPLILLKEISKELNLGAPEPRLLGDAARNTILSTYHVGIYSDKKLIGNGYGENLSIAIDAAAQDALLGVFGIRNNMKPLKFSN